MGNVYGHGLIFGRSFEQCKGKSSGCSGGDRKGRHNCRWRVLRTCRRKHIDLPLWICLAVGSKFSYIHCLHRICCEFGRLFWTQTPPIHFGHQHLDRRKGNKVQNRFSVYMDWKNQKPLLNCVSTVIALMGLAWIGNRINNFLLAYLLTMGTFIFPKLQRQGFFQNEYFKSLVEKAQIEKKTAQLMETMTMKLGSLVKQGETWYKEKCTTIKTE